MKKTMMALLPVLALAACGTSQGATPAAASIAATSAGPTRFQAASSACGNVFDVADQGKTILIDTRGKDDTAGADLQQLGCLLVQLQMPTSVTSHVDQTRALDGQQTDEWDQIKARWSYHPDTGLAMTLVDAKV